MGESPEDNYRRSYTKKEKAQMALEKLSKARPKKKPEQKAPAPAKAKPQAKAKPKPAPKSSPAMTSSPRPKAKPESKRLPMTGENARPKEPKSKAVKTAGIPAKDLAAYVLGAGAVKAVGDINRQVNREKPQPAVRAVGNSTKPAPSSSKSYSPVRALPPAVSARGLMGGRRPMMPSRFDEMRNMSKGGMVKK